MKTNKLSHKGFTGSAEVSLDDECLHGRIQFIDDVISYEGQNTTELTAAFKAAVDHYLAYCKSTGKPANKPFSGTFNIRVGPDLHRLCAIQANEKGQNLNEFVLAAIQVATGETQITRVEHNHHHQHEVKVVTQGESFTASTPSAGMQYFDTKPRYDNSNTHH